MARAAARSAATADSTDAVRSGTCTGRNRVSRVTCSARASQDRQPGQESVCASSAADDACGSSPSSRADSATRTSSHVMIG
ncbi:hypothetical protein MCAG_04124 [Micromonospora sp. ATCC 39149]|nr:hypothetical protein MCAG_04124 [Micromonospora sp. ATCC 39149]